MPFDFKLHCIICRDVCDKIVDQRRPLDRRNVYEVRSMSCKESIQNAAVSHNDEWGNTVSAHLDVVIDLVAAEAKYKI